MPKELQFIVRLKDVQKGITRADLKLELEDILGRALKGRVCEGLSIVRYNPSAQVRKGKIMQQTAKDAIASAVRGSGK